MFKMINQILTLDEFYGIDKDIEYESNMKRRTG
jgi:hypothetical protein